MFASVSSGACRIRLMLQAGLVIFVAVKQAVISNTIIKIGNSAIYFLRKSYLRKFNVNIWLFFSFLNRKKTPLDFF